MRKRAMTGALAAISIAFAPLLLSAVPAQAASVGAVATPTGVTATSTSSSVIVGWDGKTETLDVSLGLDSSTGSVGLVLPTPAKAVVSAGDPDLFTQAEAATDPVAHEEDDWWGRTAPAVPVAASVSPTPLGTVAPTRVRASNHAGLSKWLKKHSLTMSKAERSEIAEYADDGWSLSLIALDSTAAVDGQLAPLRLTFATDEPIIPTRLAAADSASTSMRVYAFGDHRTQLRVPASTRNLNAAQQVVWAGPVAQPALRTLGEYLTVTDLRFAKPEAQVTSDVGIVDAEADDTFIPSVVVYTPISLLGFPLGWLLVVWGGIGVLLAIVYLVNRFRSQ